MFIKLNVCFLFLIRESDIFYNFEIRTVCKHSFMKFVM